MNKNKSELAADIAAYLANGGTITQLKPTDRVLTEGLSKIQKRLYGQLGDLSSSGKPVRRP